VIVIPYGHDAHRGMPRQSTRGEQGPGPRVAALPIPKTKGSGHLGTGIGRLCRRQGGGAYGRAGGQGHGGPGQWAVQGAVDGRLGLVLDMPYALHVRWHWRPVAPGGPGATTGVNFRRRSPSALNGNI
jgi:hypothetical protein